MLYQPARLQWGWFSLLLAYRFLPRIDNNIIYNVLPYIPPRSKRRRGSPCFAQTITHDIRVQRERESTTCIKKVVSSISLTLLPISFGGVYGDWQVQGISLTWKKIDLLQHRTLDRTLYGSWINYCTIQWWIHAKLRWIFLLHERYKPSQSGTNFRSKSNERAALLFRPLPTSQGRDSKHY